MANSTIAEKIAQAESERQRIAANIAAAYTEAEAKGATMPASENSANLPTAIRSIPEAVQPTLIPMQITENGTYTAADDNADGYNEVTVDVPSGGEFVHTRDIVLDEDVAKIAIEFSENTIAAYLECDLPVIVGAGGSNEWLYPYFSGKAHGVYVGISRRFNGYCLFISFKRNDLEIKGYHFTEGDLSNKKIYFSLYYSDSVFSAGGTIQIYECFGKGLN